MGMYNIRGQYTNSLDSAGIIECYDEPGIEASLRIVAESELNYNKLMQAVAKDELGYYCENGVDMVYEAGGFSDFIEKIKSFFKKLWEKIKGLFRAFFAKMDSFIKSDKDFATKYKDRIINADIKDFKYKGFKFTNLDNSKTDAEAIYKESLSKMFAKMEVVSKLGISSNDSLESSVNSIEKTNLDAKVIKDAIAAYNENEQDIVEEGRDVLGLGANNSTDFNKELFRYFRDDEDTKQEKEGSDLNRTELLSVLMGSKKELDTVKKDYTKYEKEINAIIKELDKISNKLLHSTPDKKATSAENESAGLIINVINIISKSLKNALGVAQTVNGAKMTAIKDQSRQCKAIAVSLVRRKKIGESYDGYSDGSNFLESVKFI